MTEPLHLQTKHEIQAVLEASGLQPLRRLGQNFLIDGNLMRGLVRAAEIAASDLVIEIGPGTGGLTDLLLGSGANVVAVELDRGLCVVLRDRYRDRPRFTLLEGDALQRKHEIMRALADAIRAYDSSAGGCVRLVANLPYQAATPIVMNLLVAFPQVRRFVFTVQAEVGERLLATAGTEAYGPLGIVAQTLATAQLIHRLPPQAFWPAPKVESVMVRMDVQPSPFASTAEAGAFAALVRGAFEHRRKVLRSSLRYLVPEPVLAELSRRFDLGLRAERLSPGDWLDVHRFLHPLREAMRESTARGS